jgi:hypothetical protein
LRAAAVLLALAAALAGAEPALASGALERARAALGDLDALPVKADVRKAIGKDAGETVVVRLQERIA